MSASPRRRTAASLLAAVLLFGCGGAPPEAGPAPRAVQRSRPSVELVALQRIPQRTSQWCWAATTQMALDQLLGRERAPALCGDGGILQSSFVLGMPADCEAVCLSCGDPADPDLKARCVQVSWPPLDEFGVAFDQTPAEKVKSAAAALSWDELKEQLSPGADGRAAPVPFAWYWTGGGGHVLIANGFVEDPALGDAGRLVLVQDPWPPCVGDTYLLPYEAWVGSPETGRVHWRSYWNLRAGTLPEPPAGGWQRQPIPAPLTPMLPAAQPVDPALGAPIGPPADATAVARRGLRVLRRLADRDTTRDELGFLSVQDLRRSAFTRHAVSHRRVGLDELRGWTPEQDPAQLADQEDWLFPVTRLEGGAVFTAIAVERRGGSWELAEMGGKGWIERIAAALRSVHLVDPPWPQEECWLLAVPSLRKYFVARDLGAEGLHLLELPAAMKPPSTTPRAAAEVFAELREAAIQADGERPG